MKKVIFSLFILMLLVCNISFATELVPLSDNITDKNFMLNFNSLGGKLQPIRQLKLNYSKIINNGSIKSYNFSGFDNVYVVMYCELDGSIQDIKIVSDALKKPVLADALTVLRTLDQPIENVKTGHIDLILNATQYGKSNYWSINTNRNYCMTYKEQGKFIVLELFATR